MTPEEQKQEVLRQNNVRMSYWDNYREAKGICHDNIKRINKRGGSRQRREGIKLLLRVIIRLGEAQNKLWYEEV